jgi:hypothetical protein
MAERNNGGDMVEGTVRMVDPNVSFRAVHASRGKVTRAEPISALYEQGRVHHVGTFAEHLGEENIAVYGTFASKLLRLQNELIETLNRHRRGNSQTVNVNHVHIHPGGRGVVGVVNADTRGRGGDQN